MNEQDFWEQQIPSARRPRGFGLPIDPAHAARLVSITPPEFESPNDIALRLKKARHKAILWVWVQRKMRERLEYLENWSIRYHLLDGHSFAEAGRRLEVSASTVKRAEQRGIEKLRDIAWREGVSWSVPPRPGRPVSGRSLDEWRDR